MQAALSLHIYQRAENGAAARTIRRPRMARVDE
jgi:hypothetical protein